MHAVHDLFRDFKSRLLVVQSCFHLKYVVRFGVAVSIEILHQSKLGGDGVAIIAETDLQRPR